MDLAVFRKNCMIAIAEQSGTGHINIIKGAFAVQNSIPGKGKFLHSPLVALYRNMLAVNAKGGCIASPCGNWCIHIGFQNNGCLGICAVRNILQRGAQFIIVGNLVGRFRKGGDGGFLIGRFVQSVRWGGGGQGFRLCCCRFRRPFLPAKVLPRWWREQLCRLCCCRFRRPFLPAKALPRW